MDMEIISGVVCESGGGYIVSGTLVVRCHLQGQAGVRVLHHVLSADRLSGPCLWVHAESLSGDDIGVCFTSDVSRFCDLAADSSVHMCVLTPIRAIQQCSRMWLVDRRHISPAPWRVPCIMEGVVTDIGWTNVTSTWSHLQQQPFEICLLCSVLVLVFGATSIQICHFLISFSQLLSSPIADAGS